MLGTIIRRPVTHVFLGQGGRVAAGFLRPAYQLGRKVDIGVHGGRGRRLLPLRHVELGHRHRSVLPPPLEAVPQLGLLVGGHDVLLHARHCREAGVLRAESGRRVTRVA